MFRAKQKGDPFGVLFMFFFYTLLTLIFRLGLIIKPKIRLQANQFLRSLEMKTILKATVHLRFHHLLY